MLIIYNCCHVTCFWSPVTFKTWKFQTRMNDTLNIQIECLAHQVPNILCYDREFLKNGSRFLIFCVMIGNFWKTGVKTCYLFAFSIGIKSATPPPPLYLFLHLQSKIWMVWHSDHVWWFVLVWKVRIGWVVCHLHDDFNRSTITYCIWRFRKYHRQKTGM